MWLRKGFVHLLALVLLLSLLGLAVSTGTNLALSKPSKVEKTLNDSGFYTNFAAYATQQAQKSASNEGADAALQQDPTIKDDASTVFSPQLLKQLTDAVLQGNYAWLQGKTAQPDFAVNLSNAKQDFAKRVGDYVQGRLETLPACTPQQLALLPETSQIDLLAVDCRPAGLSPATGGAQVTQSIANSSQFLGDPVVTAQSISSKQSNNNRPYYAKLSSLPKLYRLGQKLPVITAVLAILSILGLVFIHPQRQTGARRAGIIFLIAAGLLVLSKLVSDFAFNKADHRIFSHSSIGPLQHSLINFMHRIQHQLVAIDMYFAVAYLLIGIALLLALRRLQAAPVNSVSPGPPQARRLGLVPNPDIKATDSTQAEPTGPPPLKKPRGKVQ